MTANKAMRILWIPFLILALTGCGSEGPPKDEKISLPLSTAEWEELNYEFGDVKQGEVIRHKYYFTNTGTKPVKVFGVKPGCSCTTGDYSEGEIAPGQKGFVELIFDSKDKEGLQIKSATVKLNTPDSITTLRFRANILVPAK